MYDGCVEVLGWWKCVVEGRCRWDWCICGKMNGFALVSGFHVGVNGGREWGREAWYFVCVEGILV